MKLFAVTVLALAVLHVAAADDSAATTSSVKEYTAFAMEAQPSEYDAQDAEAPLSESDSPEGESAIAKRSIRTGTCSGGLYGPMAYLSVGACKGLVCSSGSILSCQCTHNVTNVGVPALVKSYINSQRRCVCEYVNWNEFEVPYVKVTVQTVCGSA